MLFPSALSLSALLTLASTSPIPSQTSTLAPLAYKDVTLVLDRITSTVTKLANDVTSWPGNPRNRNTIPQITRHVPLILQSCNNLISDLSIGTDWIQKNKQTTLGVIDAVSLVPRLASLNSAVGSYTTSLLEKRAWADTSSATPDIYDELVLQKQWSNALSQAITQSLGVTTSWLGGPISDFFFGAKLDEAIRGYADGAKYRPGNVAPPPQQGGPQWGAPTGQDPYASPRPQYAPQQQGNVPWDGAQPYQGEPPAPFQQGGWSPSPPL